MEECNYPIRKALKSQEIRQEDLATQLGISRQTLSRYLSQYERTGYVANGDAQKEFDRLVAIEKQRLSGLLENKSRLAMAQQALKTVDERERDNKIRYDRLLRDILANHPEQTMYDFNEVPVTPETLDLDKAWVNIGCIENEELLPVLSPSERKRLDDIQKEMSDAFETGCINTSIEEACIVEQIWDSTEPNGKPMVYHDEFECVLSEEEAKAGLFRFECDNFCMCNGGMARLYVDELNIPEFDHKLEVDVYAVVEVITDKGLMYIDTVELSESEKGFGRFIGQIDDLVPGYKYVYSLGISAGDYDEVDDLEYTLLEGYSTKGYHPLK